MDVWETVLAESSADAVDFAGSEYAALIGAVRRLQDLMASTSPPTDAMAEATNHLRSATEVLQRWPLPSTHIGIGRRSDLPGRGSPLLPPFVYTERSDDSVAGHVVFTPYYIGGNRAAHGGSVTLFFDELLGRLSNSSGRPKARTAYLHINYRDVTPIDVDLRFDASLDRTEGRKRFVSGRLFEDNTLVADAQGLFVILLAGQP